MTQTDAIKGVATDDAKTLASTYFRAWKNKDFAALRAVLADDVTFRGPLGQADDADQCIAGLRGMSEIVTDIVIKKMIGDGPDVVTWFDLHTTKTDDPVTTANWSHVEDGKIATIRVTFDARPLAPPT
jgi:ketosteroid isomerase-like protein